MKRSIVFFLFIASALNIVEGRIVPGINQNNLIYGIWHIHPVDVKMDLILHKDGTGEFDGEEITFGIKDDKITILAFGNPAVYFYRLQENSLQLSGADLKLPLNYFRDGSDIPDLPDGTSDTVGLDRAILGVWSGENGSIEFRSGRECIYQGKSFDYQATGENVWLKSQAGIASFSYKIAGDRLTLSTEKSSTVFSKGAEETKQIAVSPSNRPGIIAQDLVGKWCFKGIHSYDPSGGITTECFTLNGDGTYLYNVERSGSRNGKNAGNQTLTEEDFGTWYVQGDKLHIISKTKDPASYFLERKNHPVKTTEPMIVLDGKAFEFNKPSW